MSRTVAIVLAAGVCATGCLDARTSHLVPVTGTVRQGGVPLAGGTVVFVAIPPLRSPLVFGDIGANGRYSLRSANKYPGVAPGHYAVCVALAEPPPAAKPTDGVLPDPFQPRVVKSRLPPEYGSAANTPLRCEVPPGGTTFDISLPAGGPTSP
jgi:hypothetical protein